MFSHTTSLAYNEGPRDWEQGGGCVVNSYLLPSNSLAPAYSALHHGSSHWFSIYFADKGAEDEKTQPE